MRGLTASEVLSLHDLASGHSPADRALLLLQTAEPELSWDELERLPIGTRDVRLLQLRAATFGPDVRGVAPCPACSTQVEFVIATAALIAGPASDPPALPSLTQEDFKIRLRPLNTRDLQLAQSQPDVEHARRALALCAVVEATRSGQSIAVEELPDSIIQPIADTLDRADPAAELSLELDCPECARTWSPTLDVAGFFWAELDAERQRLLHQVHLLARAYGWREGDVLALSPARRQAYLELVS